MELRGIITSFAKNKVTGTCRAIRLHVCIENLKNSNAESSILSNGLCT